MKLSNEFYLQKDVLKVSGNLLGKVLYTRFKNKTVGAIITETEAYCGIRDKASHAYGNRKTTRTAVMYEPGGIAYVYLCYGIHSLFNVVTGPAEVPTAVLIRSVVLLKRNGKTSHENRFLNGPGKLTKAMGIHYSITGCSLTGKQIWIEDEGIKMPVNSVIRTPRIGVDYAGSDVLLPYRFVVEQEFIENFKVSY